MIERRESNVCANIYNFVNIYEPAPGVERSEHHILLIQVVFFQILGNEFAIFFLTLCLGGLLIFLMKFLHLLTLSLLRVVIVGGGNSAGYAARALVEHGMADKKLCIVTKEVLVYFVHFYLL